MQFIKLAIKHTIVTIFVNLRFKKYIFPMPGLRLYMYIVYRTVSIYQQVLDKTHTGVFLPIKDQFYQSTYALEIQASFVFYAELDAQ